MNEEHYSFNLLDDEVEKLESLDVVKDFLEGEGYSTIEHSYKGDAEVLDVYISCNGEPDVSIKYIEKPISCRIEVDAKAEFEDVYEAVIEYISGILEN